MSRKASRLLLILLLTCLSAITALGSSEPSAPSYSVKMEFSTRVKMRDGVELSVDIYRPDSAGRFPVILSRTPYNKSTARGGNVELGRYFAARGYVYVAMDVRGRGDSDGKFVPYRNEGPDGYDSIEWCAQQSWSTGKVGTIGASYLGYDQWIAAVTQPPHLTTMIVMTTPPDPFVESPTGLQSPTYMSWHLLTSGHVLHNLDPVDWPAVYSHLPIYTMDQAAGLDAPYWRQVVDHPGIDQWWDPLIYQNKYDRVRVPIMHVSGWYDDEQAGATMNYIGMTTKGATDEIRRSQKLLMGPWPHAVNSTTRLGDVEFGPTAVIDIHGYELRWFDYWLKGTDTGIMQEPPVRIFVMGENKWHDEKEWPLARTKYADYYLHSKGRANSFYGDGTLSVTPPGSDEPADKYAYDPAMPVPFIMEPTYAQLGGPDDYRPVERRDDVLVYTSEPLAKVTTVCGPIRVKLSAASSATDTDFMGKLIDVWPDGFAQRLYDGMVRARYREGGDKPSLITPGQIYTYDIDLWNTCQQFGTGHRIRLEIASSAFPKYDRNQNTGETLGKTANFKIADQVIYHDAKHPSLVRIPIVEEKP